MKKVPFVLVLVGALCLTIYAIVDSVRFSGEIKAKVEAARMQEKQRIIVSRNRPVPGAQQPPVTRHVPETEIFPGGDNRVVYSDFLTSGTGDSYCASRGLQCTNLVNCQLDKGGCNPSEYCGDPRSPECPCTARCASSPNISDDQGSCGSCRWVDIECSHYGGYWDGQEVPCDPAHAGVVVMKHHNNNCGSQHLESYTRERWDECFTPRAQCVCK